METTQNITLKRLLSQVAEREASNLHLIVGNKPVIRVDDDLITLDSEDVITQDFAVSLIDSILTEKQKKEFLEKKEIIFVYDFINQSRFRVDITYQRDLYSFVFHYIPSIIKKLPDLGFPKEVEDLTNQKKGLVLIGGQHGSGVSTTLAGFVESINQRESRHILMLSKPIEYSLVSYQSIIEEQEIGKDVSDWSSALDINEQDIDVVVIDRIESLDVLKKVLELSRGGVLVCAGVRTDSIENMIQSLVLLASPEEREHIAALLADVLQGAVVQALIPKVGGGRILALEVAFGSPSIQRSIMEQKFDQISNTIQTSRTEGMILLDRYLAELVKKGQVDRAIAKEHAVHPDSFDGI